MRIGEIDIIAREGEELVFIEVKYRSSLNFGGAEYAIPYAKQQVIRRVAQWYLARCHLSPETYCRFDAVLIDGEEINHIRNAF